MRSQNVCPKDHQSLDWHLKYQNTTGQGKPLYFGDLLGCGYISPLDRAAADERHKQEQRKMGPS